MMPDLKLQLLAALDANFQPIISNGDFSAENKAVILGLQNSSIGTTKK